MDDLVKRLNDRAAIRERAYADDGSKEATADKRREKAEANRHLVVCAKESLEDAKLLREAAAALQEAQNEMTVLEENLADAETGGH